MKDAAAMSGKPDENMGVEEKGKGKEGKDDKDKGKEEKRKGTEVEGKGNDNAEGNEGKDSWGPYEVGGKGNDKDKGKEGKGSLAYDPQEELFAGVLMRDGNYWPGEDANTARRARARALAAHLKAKNGLCLCSDTERKNMFNEKAMFAGRWKHDWCHWCCKHLPEEFLQQVRLVPLVLASTQVPLVLEAPQASNLSSGILASMTQGSNTEQAIPEARAPMTEQQRITDVSTNVMFENVLHWQEILDNTTHNHSSKLTAFGEKLDAAIKVTRASEDEHAMKIAKVATNVLKLSVDMDTVICNQKILMVQMEKLLGQMEKLQTEALDRAVSKPHA